MEGSQGVKKFICWCLRTRNPKKRFLVRFFLKYRISKEFYKEMGYKLDLQNPETLNEKLQWFKMYVRDPIITLCADKYAVRKYVREKIGESHLVPLYGVYSSIQAIELDSLPEQFVLKPNHESGRVIICKDKNKMNWIKEADKMNNWLHENYYYWTAEWGYKNISPKIICEKLLSGEIIDYKFFCFKGMPVLAQINQKKDDGCSYRSGFFDLSFQQLSSVKKINWRNLIEKEPFQKPNQWEDMIKLARILSADFPFVRVDLYDLNGHIYFGELTFTPENGMGRDYPAGWDEKMGELFDLSAFNPKYVIQKS